jgi:transposase
LKQSCGFSTQVRNGKAIPTTKRYIGAFMLGAAMKNLIGDRAYDSDPLDEELRRDGIEMIAPHRANRSKPPTQDRRRLTRYMRRWLVERFFAWIQWQRRILVRWGYHTQNFLALFNSPASLSSSGDFEIGSSTSSQGSALVFIPDFRGMGRSNQATARMIGPHRYAPT